MYFMRNILIHPGSQGQKRQENKPSPGTPVDSIPITPGIPFPSPPGIPGLDGRLHILSKELQTLVNSSPTTMYHIHIMFINTEMVNKTLPVCHSHLSYPLTYTIPPQALNQTPRHTHPLPYAFLSPCMHTPSHLSRQDQTPLNQAYSPHSLSQRKEGHIYIKYKHQRTPHFYLKHTTK